MNPMIVLVRFCQLCFVHEQFMEPVAPAQFEILVHLDRFKRANFHANLATHANRDIDIEDFRIKLRFAHVIGLLVFAFNDIDALRWTFLLANLAGHTTQSRFRVLCVIN